MCILAKRNEETTPSRDRMEKLIQAGLGRMKLIFPDKNADHNNVTKFLEEKIPKLKRGGGFHVLRAVGGGGGKRQLSILPPGKERMGQAVAYIRPLQLDLDESPFLYKVCI